MSFNEKRRIEEMEKHKEKRRRKRKENKKDEKPEYIIRARRRLSLDVVFVEAANVLDLQVPKARRGPHTSATHQLQQRRALNQLKGEGVKEVGVGGEGEW